MVRNKPMNIHWSAAILAGLAGGMAMLILEMLLVPLALGGPAWGPPRMMAAIVMGQGVLGASFGGPVIVGLMVHLALSVAFAIGLAFLINRRSAGTATLIGAAFGLALYLVNFYVFTAVFPWFAGARNWVTIFTHLVYGASAGAVYAAITTRVTSTGRTHYRRRRGGQKPVWQS